MSIGQIVQVIGAVVDIEFPRDAMPKIYEALVLKNDEADSLAENGLTFEVEQQLGDGVVRTIAMGTSEGLRRHFISTPILIVISVHELKIGINRPVKKVERQIFQQVPAN